LFFGHILFFLSMMLYVSTLFLLNPFPSLIHLLRRSGY
jgi:hypothetical protein